MKRSSSDHSLTASSLRSHHYETRDIQGSPDTPFQFSYIDKNEACAGSMKGSPEDALLHASSCQSSDSEFDVICTYSHELSEANELIVPRSKPWNLQRLSGNSTITESEDPDEDDSAPVLFVGSASKVAVPYVNSGLYGNSGLGIGSTACSPPAKSDILASSVCSSPRASSMSSFGVEVRAPSCR
jgi:hypothetical protein